MGLRRAMGARHASSCAASGLLAAPPKLPTLSALGWSSAAAHPIPTRAATTRAAASTSAPSSVASASARSAAPDAPPASDAQLEALAAAVAAARRLVVITGAGCSTESGIPDYRSPGGAYASGFKPMTHQQFMASAANRSRYWARSFAGWRRFAASRPNAAHVALAELEARGWVSGIVTQNVDRLHSAAGAAHVLELHGSTHEWVRAALLWPLRRAAAPIVVCLGCGRTTPRAQLQAQLAALNPGAAAAAAAAAAAPPSEPAERATLLRAGSREDVGAGRMRPDGDVELGGGGGGGGRGFVVPPCEACGGALKPDVVFFGDNLPAPRKERAAALVAGADAVLVAGSSLTVYSAYRLVEGAAAAGARVLVVDVGPTRGDRLATLKVEARAGEVLARLARHPSLLLPKLAA